MIRDPHFEVVGVVTQPDRPAGRNMRLQPSPVAALAQTVGIPVFKFENVNTSEALGKIEALRAETAVVVAFGQILKNQFLDLFPAKVVNVHASLLPRWRGAAPIQRALMAGDQTTGVSLQIMVRKLDAGPILGERPIPLNLETDALMLYRQCEALATQLLSVDLMDYLRGNLSPVSQDESKVTLAPKVEKAEAEIEWNRGNLEIHNLVRGLVMGPVAQTRRLGRLLKVHRTRPRPADGASRRPGQAAVVTENSLIVQCGQGTLELLEVQPESRSKMPISEYLRGYPVRTGDMFGPGQ